MEAETGRVAESLFLVKQVAVEEAGGFRSLWGKGATASVRDLRKPEGDREECQEPGRGALVYPGDPRPAAEAGVVPRSSEQVTETQLRVAQAKGIYLLV